MKPEGKSRMLEDGKKTKRKMQSNKWNKESRERDEEEGDKEELRVVEMRKESYQWKD